MGIKRKKKLTRQPRRLHRAKLYKRAEKIPARMSHRRNSKGYRLTGR